eukprot:8282947-Pyramimonas_sp.AAC.1
MSLQDLLRRSLQLPYERLDNEGAQLHDKEIDRRLRRRRGGPGVRGERVAPLAPRPAAARA